MTATGLESRSLGVVPARRVFELSASGVWRDRRFLEMLFRGLARDGAPESAIRSITGWIETESPRNYADFRQIAARRCPGLPDAERRQCQEVLDRLDDHVQFNSTCYVRDSPEKARVTQWPNNSGTKSGQPSHYFDIYEDFFYRTPHRFVTPETPIGSAGSCFALRIAHQLQLWGYKYILEEDDLPPDVPLEKLTSTSYRMSSARCGTLFNVPSMRQMVERGFGLWEPERVLVRDGARIIDPFRATKAGYRDDAGFEKDYETHSAAIRRALLKCEVFVLTLGLTETWQFADSGSYTSLSPWKVDPALLRHRLLSVAENVAELERLHEVYQRHRPGIKLILSVSPVPLLKTFSSELHVVEANALSKATLLVAAREFCGRHPDSVFYFPAYEIVTSGCREPWEDDMRHVSPAAVARVMGLFQKMFLVDQHPLPGTSTATLSEWDRTQAPPAPPRKLLARLRSVVARGLGRA